MGLDDDWLNTLKVGDLRRCLAQDHENMRVVDVPGFAELVKGQEPSWKKSFFESVGKMWVLLDRLSLEFSQVAAARDLELAHCMSDLAGPFSQLLMAYKLELPERLAMVDDVAGAVDEAVAHTASAGLHSLSMALETLRVGVSGNEESMAEAKEMLKSLVAGKAAPSRVKVEPSDGARLGDMKVFGHGARGRTLVGTASAQRRGV